MAIDGDLEYCLEYNPQEHFFAPDIAEVLAVIEGVPDETNWHWLVRLHDGRHVYITGGCDYTGWD